MATPNPQDVAEFLKSEAAPGSVSFVADQAVKDELLSSPVQAEEAPVERIQIPMDPSFDPDARTQETIMFWTMELPVLGVIKVEEADKVMYQKSLQEDIPIELRVELHGTKFNALVRSRSVFDQKVIFAALQQLTHPDKDGFIEIQDPSTYLTRAQMFTAAVAVREINDQEFPHLDLIPANGVRAESERLREHVSQYIEPMNGPRWGALLQALRVFEAKLKLCNDNVNNESFWQPVS